VLQCRVYPVTLRWHLCHLVLQIITHSNISYINLINCVIVNVCCEVCVSDTGTNITCTWGHYSVCKSGLLSDSMYWNIVQVFFSKKLIKKLFLVILRSDLLYIFNKQRHVWVIRYLPGKFNTSVNSRTFFPQKTSISAYCSYMCIL
jgi:hypothetical protein